jgi:hypothetical protein
VGVTRRRAPRPRTTSQTQDRAYKRLFSTKELVADLIRGYVSPELAQRLDLDSLERCNGSYVSQDLRGRANDIVWRLRVQDRWVYVYLLLEFQSTVDRTMAVRLLGYIALLWQDLIAAQELGPDGLLPPVLPIVLYNGDRPWDAPVQLRSLIAAPIPALEALQPDLTYVWTRIRHRSHRVWRCATWSPRSLPWSRARRPWPSSGSCGCCGGGCPTARISRKSWVSGSKRPWCAPDCSSGAVRLLPSLCPRWNP